MHTTLMTNRQQRLVEEATLEFFFMNEKNEATTALRN